MLARLIDEATRLGYDLTLGEAYRPGWVAQEYERRGIGAYPSFHTSRLAIDLNLFIDGKYVTDSGKYLPLGAFWTSIGGTWGGRFGRADGNHFSYKERVDDLAPREET